MGLLMMNSASRGRDDEHTSRLGESRDVEAGRGEHRHRVREQRALGKSHAETGSASSLRVAMAGARAFLCPRGRGRSRHRLAERQGALAGTRPHDGGTMATSASTASSRAASATSARLCAWRVRPATLHSQPLRGNQRGLGRPAPARRRPQAVIAYEGLLADGADIAQVEN